VRAARENCAGAAAARYTAQPGLGPVADPGFRRLLLVNWLLSSCWDVHTFVVPVLGHERGLSASVIGSILGAFAIAAALIRVLLPVIASGWPNGQRHHHAPW
jgi:hypothetical protein